jgi:hypothetical protein
MHRKYAFALALLLVLGMGLCYVYAPSSYVWNNDVEALRRVTPPLRTLLTVELLLLLGVGLLGLRLVSIQSSKQKIGALLLVLFGWGLAEKLVHQQLATEHYTIWKYEFTDAETSQQAQPAITTKLLPLFLHDVQSSTEPTRIRAKLAVALGEARTQAAYPALQAIVQDPHQNPYLQFHCLKALRLLQPQRFSTVLATSPSDSAIALYRKYEPSKL